MELLWAVEIDGNGVNPERQRNQERRGEHEPKANLVPLQLRFRAV
jgi:hypothetical protein